jgi:hypothetical protein
MADIAVVFHWSLQSMEAMDLHELARWHKHAVERSGPEQ